MHTHMHNMQDLCSSTSEIALSMSHTYTAVLQLAVEEAVVCAAARDTGRQLLPGAVQGRSGGGGVEEWRGWDGGVEGVGWRSGGGGVKEWKEWGRVEGVG